MSTVMLVSSPYEFFEGDLQKVNLFNENFSDFYEDTYYERRNFYMADLPYSEMLMIDAMLYKVDRNLHTYICPDLYLPGTFQNFSIFDFVYECEEDITVGSTSNYRKCVLRAREILKDFNFQENLYIFEQNGVGLNEVLDFDSTLDSLLEGIDISEKNNVPIFFSF